MWRRMGVKHLLKTELDRLRRQPKSSKRTSTVVAVALGVAVVSLGMAEAAAHVDALGRMGLHSAHLTSGPPPAHLTLVTRLVWEGADLDGDGRPDIANPTGQAPRGDDAYGEGRFHATRDGGAREHEGVDYVATPGQAVVAPISGFVSKIGCAYPGDQTLHYVEIDNPALHLTARVFYVDPNVAVGDAVAVGHSIGEAHTLQQRYRLGITDHVHLEIAERGRKVDAETLIVARAETDRLAAD
jgi:murein DD-endopeptidase MepM/ murein hydrolase activator NlpD